MSCPPACQPEIYFYKLNINQKLKIFFNEDSKLYEKDDIHYNSSIQPYYNYILMKINSLLKNKDLYLNSSNSRTSKYISIPSYIDFKFSESDEMKSLKNIFNFVITRLKNKEEFNNEFLEIFNKLYDIVVNCNYNK